MVDDIKELIFKAESDEAGERVDKCVAMRLGEGFSRTYVRYLMDNSQLTVDGRKVKPHHTVREGEEVRVKLLPVPDIEDVEPENIPIDIIYEDDWIIVVNKPCGMVVHPGAGNMTGTLVNALLYHCGKLPEVDDGMRPGIVHRLDKDTSGVMVIAKNARAMRSLAKQFQKRAVKKRYTALVRGCVQLDNGVVEAPLARNTLDRKKMGVEFSIGKKARTVYHVVKRFSNFTLVSLEPETGRTHQIRVHMKHLGHPVVGDSVYGSQHGMARQALHATALGFTHPDTGKYVEFEAPLPEDIKEVIARGKL